MPVKLASRTAVRAFPSSICSSCRRRLVQQQSRFVSTGSPSSPDDSSNQPIPSSSSSTSTPNAPEMTLTEQMAAKASAREARIPSRSIQDIFKPQFQPASSQTRTSSSPKTQLQGLLDSANAEASTRPGAGVSPNEPYHLNVYAHKHNLHITFTEPSRNPILSFSCGSIGLRKAQRGTFDAAYQLSTYTMRKMAMSQWRLGGKKMSNSPMKTLRDVGTKDTGVGIEVVLRGFGQGREAFQKALLGTEGQMIKPMIVRVTDGTRLKFGGTRSPAVRRL